MCGLWKPTARKNGFFEFLLAYLWRYCLAACNDSKSGKVWPGWSLTLTGQTTLLDGPLPFMSWQTWSFLCFWVMGWKGSCDQLNGWSSLKLLHLPKMKKEKEWNMDTIGAVTKENRILERVFYPTNLDETPSPQTLCCNHFLGKTEAMMWSFLQIHANTGVHRTN